jgi:uncharacterized protein YcgI (DUF1989 family)
MTASVSRQRIAPQSGTAVMLSAGSALRIATPEGAQVADVFAVTQRDTAECLSSGRTIDYAGTIALSVGHTLYSNRSTRLFEIEEDTAGTHDFLLAPCSLEMFRRLHGVTGDHPSCFDNLCHALGPFGVSPDAIGTTFNVFMDVAVGADGRVQVRPPRARPGDHITLRALVDLVAGVTACSAEQTNNGVFTSIDIEVLPPR